MPQIGEEDYDEESEPESETHVESDEANEDDAQVQIDELLSKRKSRSKKSSSK